MIQHFIIKSFLQTLFTSVNFFILVYVYNILYNTYQIYILKLFTFFLSAYKLNNINIRKEEHNMEIRTRFAPSPTGYMHIGNLRTALYEYLIAKSQNGKFTLTKKDL